MVRILSAILVIFLVTLGGAYWWIERFLPEYVEDQIITHFEQLDQSNFTYESIDKAGETLTFNHIKLDQDGFSTIDKLVITYSPWRYVVSSELETLSIDNMNLTGNIDTEQENSFSLSGLDTGNILKNLTALPAHDIEIKNGKLDLLSEKLGGLEIKFDAQAHASLLGELSITGNVKSEQPQLNLEGSIKGSARRDQNFELTLQIDNAKIETDKLNALRASGELKISREEENTPISYEGQFGVGGLRYGAISLQNASLALRGDDQGFQIFLDAKASGFPGTELNLSFKKSSQHNEIEGNIYTEKLEDLIQYLKANNILSDIKPADNILFGSFPLTFSFHAEHPDNFTNIDKINFDVRNDDQSFDIKGNIDLDKTKDIWEATFAMPPVNMLRELKKEKETKNYGLEFTPSTLLELSGTAKGRLSEFETAKNATAAPKKKTNQNDAIEGQIKLIIKNAELQYGVLKIKNITVPLTINDMSALSADKEQQATFKLPLKNELRQTGKATIHLSAKNGGAPEQTIDKATLNIFGGTLSVSDIKLNETGLHGPMNVKVTGINIEEFFKAAGLKGVNIKGTMNGILPIEKTENGRLILKGGILSSASKGDIAIAPELLNRFLPGKDVRTETIRMALDNYHYEKFELRLDGPLDGVVQMTLNANGNNPDIFEKRPVALNLALEGEISALLYPLMK